MLLSDEYAPKKEFSADAWRSLAPQVGQEHVPGKHNTCITSHVGELAQALNRHLAAPSRWGRATPVARHRLPDDP